MGINGLLPLLKSIQKPCHLKKFAGLTIGVDAYGWLHRGTVACAVELAMGKPTRKFVDFAMHRVRMLLHFGVTPYLVFDGDYLPSKAATEEDRRKRRETSKALGLELLSAGKVAQANLELQKAVDVTPEMARMLIEDLKKIGVQYVVAPYEADAQMVYLERKGIIGGILSEDSDLLVFGCKRLLTKLDQYGNCIEINKADFCACREVSLTGWSDAEFRRMAILSGCDYLANINNMGLKTAYRMVRKYKTIEKVVRMLQFDGKYHVPKDYLQAFYQAEQTFLHQRVYCPISKSLVYHTEPEQPLDEVTMQFIGAFVDSDTATGVAKGDLNPMTKEAIILDSALSSSAPRTPWSRPQPRHSVSSNDLKKGTPIDQFFKPKRVPLAELDPNCFTPSPTQQDALRRNSGPWVMEPAPRPYLHRAVTQPELPVPQSAPRPVTGTDRPHLRTTSITEPRPPKRARLCADDASIDSEAQSDLGRSRFFNSAAPEPSPSFGRTLNMQRSKKDDIHIYSDDSIEEALLSLPDVDGFTNIKAKKGKEIAIFDEEAVKEEAQELTAFHISSEESQTSNITSETSQTSVPGLTESESFASTTDTEPPTPTLPLLNPTLSAIKEKFAFVPTTTTSTPQIKKQGPSLLPTPPSSTPSFPKPSRIPLAVKPTPNTSTSSRVLTPLQNLGNKAFIRSTLPATPPYTPTAGFSTTSRFRKIPSAAAGGKGVLTSVPFPEVISEMATASSRRPSSSLKTVLEPTDIPLPAPDEDEQRILTSVPGTEDAAVPSSSEPTQEQVGKPAAVMIGPHAESGGKGSEDLIIRDSEAEDEEEDEAGNGDVLSSPVGEKTLNLGRFAFKA